MRFQIAYRDYFWRVAVFALVLYALVVDLVITGGLMNSQMQFFLSLASGGLAVYHVGVMVRSHVTFEPEALLISEWAAKWRIAYTDIDDVSVQGAEVRLSMHAQLAWPWRLLSGSKKEFVRKLTLNDSAGFLATLRPRLNVQQLIADEMLHEVAATSEEMQPSPAFARRAFAYLIDCAVVGYFWFNAICAVALYAVNNNLRDDPKTTFIGETVAVVGLPTIWFLYHWVFNSIGVTGGKKLMGLAVRAHAQGGAPGIGRGLLRTIGELLSVLPFGMGFWWALWDGDRRGWHDKLAGTRVVRRARARAGSRGPSPAPSATTLPS